MSRESITKHASTIGLATLLSRVLGMVRDVVIAKFFGTAIYAQAFFVAFRIPNLMRELVGEGATNSAFVPVLVEELLRKGKQEFWKIANILLNFMLILLSLLTLLGFLFASQIVYLTAPGFLSDPYKFDVTVRMAQVIVPYLILIGITAYGMGILNSLQHFATPAIGPALLNLALIVCVFIFKTDAIGLALGVLLGGVLQVLIQVPPLLKAGMRFNENKLYHPTVKRIGKLLAPRTIGAGIYQINVIVTQILASFANIAGAGAVAVLWYSNRVMQLPLAIVASAVAQASLPTMSMHVTQNQPHKLKETIVFLMRITVFILLPATVGLIVLNRPIIKILFERGAFSQMSTALTGDALICYAVGLASCGIIKILTNAYYSMHDTVTPVKLSVLSLAINIFMNIVLMHPMKASGLALANSISAITHSFMLYLFLVKKIGPIADFGLVKFFIKVFASSILMGAVSFISFKFFANIFQGGLRYSAIALLASIIIAVFSYAVFSKMFGIKEISGLSRWLSRKK